MEVFLPSGRRAWPRGIFFVGVRVAAESKKRDFIFRPAVRNSLQKPGARRTSLLEPRPAIDRAAALSANQRPGSPRPIMARDPLDQSRARTRPDWQRGSDLATFTRIHYLQPTFRKYVVGSMAFVISIPCDRWVVEC